MSLPPEPSKPPPWEVRESEQAIERLEQRIKANKKENARLCNFAWPGNKRRSDENWHLTYALVHLRAGHRERYENP